MSVNESVVFNTTKGSPLHYPPPFPVVPLHIVREQLSSDLVRLQDCFINCRRSLTSSILTRALDLRGLFRFRLRTQPCADLGLYVRRTRYVVQVRMIALRLLGVTTTTTTEYVVTRFRYPERDTCRRFGGVGLDDGVVYRIVRCWRCWHWDVVEFGVLDYDCSRGNVCGSGCRSVVL